MKKLFLLLAVGSLLMTGCHNGSKPSSDTKQTDSATVAMQEKFQKDREDWNNWENLTDERKAELLDEQKLVYEKQKAIKEAREARKAKFEAAMENWDNLSLDERKAAFDLMNPRAAKKEDAAAPEKTPDTK